jgi:uncharacterized membrane protein YheB (UPF0754 family)
MNELPMLNYILSWGLPPVVGAVIGFITNVVAIRMLFRPLAEKRVFGVRIPFTPGILPKQRGKLAISIGSMVERELITVEIIRSRLNQDDIKQTITQTLKGFFANAVNAGAGVFSDLTALLINFLKRPDIHKKLEVQGKIIVNNSIQKMSGLQRLFISAGKYDTAIIDNMDEIIDDLINSIETLLLEPDTQKKILGYIKNEFVASNRSSLEGNMLDVTVSRIVERTLDFISSKIGSVLEVINIKKIVKERIDSLEMIKVERIVLDVMASQFKWIDIFGGILGAFIGIFQAFLSHILM